MEKVIPGDWKKYRVSGEPGTDANPNLSCSPFTAVTHAAHLRHAIDIVPDGKIRRSSISDKTLLVDEKIKVVWTSPFIWETGSRYGCVQWTFRWKDLLRDCNFYWVEVVHYNYPACRFLITRNKYKNHDLLRKYDPTEKEGPWWYDAETKTHYQNRETACVEFMIEDDLFIDEALKLEFVRHSHKYCCLNRNHPPSCPEFFADPAVVGARLISQVIGLSIMPYDLRVTQRQDAQTVATEPMMEAWKALRERLYRTQGDFNQGVTWEHPSAKALARSILLAFGKSNHEERKALTLLFQSAEDAVRACRAILQEEIKITQELPLEEDGPGEE